jgi:hypothetical protein
MSIIINPKNNFKYSRKNSSEGDLETLSEALGKFGDEIQTGLIASVATTAAIFGGSALINEYRANQNQPTQAEIGKKIEIGSQDIVNAMPPESQRLGFSPKYDKYNRSLRFDVEASEGETIKPETRQAIIDKLRADFPGYPSHTTFTSNSENKEIGFQIEVPFAGKKMPKKLKKNENTQQELKPIPTTKLPTETTTEWDDMQAEKLAEKKQKAIEDKNIKNGKYIGKY